MRFRVQVRLRAAVRDPAGEAVADALRALGLSEIRGVRVGKLVELELAEDDPARGQARVEDACRRLLANPAIEDFVVERQD